ncbi:MAG: N-acetyltransferase [Gammaproteobacteria bacterium]|nr:N-acetyltransferase [Gammaproteobacteria bacterium]
MDSTTAIRSATTADAPAIAAIYAHHVSQGTATFDTAPRSLAATIAKIDECRSRHWPFLVAEGGDEIVGYAYATQFRDRPAYGFACEDSIYVHPSHLSRGIGTRLLTALVSDATRAGFRQMIAVIGGGEPRSIALHSRVGFRHAGRLHAVGRKFGRWLDTVYLQIALGSGDADPPPD